MSLIEKQNRENIHKLELALKKKFEKKKILSKKI